MHETVQYMQWHKFYAKEKEILEGMQQDTSQRRMKQVYFSLVIKIVDDNMFTDEQRERKADRKQKHILPDIQITRVMWKPSVELFENK